MNVLLSCNVTVLLPLATGVCLAVWNPKTAFLFTYVRRVNCKPYNTTEHSSSCQNVPETGNKQEQCWRKLCGGTAILV